MLYFVLHVSMENVFSYSSSTLNTGTIIVLEMKNDLDIDKIKCAVQNTCCVPGFIA